MGSITPDNGTATIMNEAASLKLQDAYHGAADSLETPHDVMLRLFNAVSTRHISQVQLQLLTKIQYSICKFLW
jgi:hypothetical protein